MSSNINKELSILGGLELELKHGDFIQVLKFEDTFVALGGKDNIHIGKGDFKKLLANELIKYVGKKGSYNIYLLIDKNKVKMKTVLKKDLIEELAKYGYFYIPNEYDDFTGLTFRTTYGAEICFLTKLCEQGFEVSVDFKVACNDKNIMINSDLIKVIYEITKYLNKKLIK